MKIKCDICENHAVGSQSELMEQGWIRSIFYTPVRKTLTRCPEHSDTMSSAIIELLNKYKK